MRGAYGQRVTICPEGFGRRKLALAVAPRFAGPPPKCGSGIGRGRQWTGRPALSNVTESPDEKAPAALIVADAAVH
jgi:hypothetical protein